MAGDRLLNLARAWFDDTTVARVFEPLVADWQLEIAGASRRVRWRLHAAWMVTFLLVCARCFMIRIGSNFFGASAAFVAVALAIAMAIAGTISVWVAGGQSIEVDPVALVGGSMASLAMLMLPLAALPAAMYSRRAGATRADLVTSAAVLTLLVIAFVGWIGPFGAQVSTRAFDEVRVQRAIARGLSEERFRAHLQQSRPAHLPVEMTVPSLVSAWRSGVAVPRPPQMVREVNRRAAMVPLTVAMAMLGWALARRPHNRRWHWIALWFLGVCATLSSVWQLAAELARHGDIPLWSPPWVTLAVPTLLTMWVRTRPDPPHQPHQPYFLLGL